MIPALRAVAAPPPPATASTAEPGRTRLAPALRRPELSPYAWRLAGITLLGLLARVVWVGRQAFWRDEAFTELTSRKSWLDMLDVVRHDSAPPLSYVLTHLATSISTSSWALRLPAALAGTAAIPLAAALGRRIGGDRAGLCAAGLVMLSPSYVLASRDARMYAMAGTMVLWVALALWRAVEMPSRGRLAMLSAAVAAALFTQYFTALAIATAAVAAVVILRPPRRTLLRCAAAMAAGAAPLAVWLPIAAPQFAHAGSPFWVPAISGSALLGILTEFVAGPPVDSGLPYRTAVQYAQAGTLLVGGVAALLLLYHLAVRADHRERRATGYVLAVGLGAIGLMLAISLRKSLVEARYASVLWPPLTVLLGVGLSRIRPRQLASIPFGAFALATAMLVILPLRTDVRPLVRELGATPAAHEMVLAHREVYLMVLAEASPALAAQTRVASPSLDWYWGTAVFPTPSFIDAVPGDVTRIDEIYEAGSATYANLPAAFHEVSQDCVPGACLTVWER
jgi:4-amino-4-deoxy-L-arabinose transferase-like glycosyltransferase